MVDPVLSLELGDVYMTGLACGYTQCCTLPLKYTSVYVRCMHGVYMVYLNNFFKKKKNSPVIYPSPGGWGENLRNTTCPSIK